VSFVPVDRIPVVVLDLSSASAPTPTGVLSRNNRVINWFTASLAQESNEYMTKILLLVALGVIEAENPVTSANVELVIANVSVFVVDTTCKITFFATPCNTEDCFILATVTISSPS